MKMKATHMILLVLLVFCIGFMANHIVFGGKLPVEFPILFASALFFVLASYNKTAAKMRNILFALVLVIGIIWLIIWIQGV